MTMITPSYLGETIEYSSLHACRSTLEDPTCGAISIIVMSRPARSMAANCPTFKAGTRFQRPTGSSGLMVGIERRSNPVASLSARIEAHSYRSMSPESGSQYTQTALP